MLAPFSPGTCPFHHLPHTPTAPPGPGMAASKKWKYTLRVPMEGGEAALLGDWMEARGLAVKAHLRHPRCHMAPPLSSERGSGLLDAPSAAAPRSGGREAGPASTRLTREAAVRRRAEAPEPPPEPAQTVAPAPLQPTSAGPAAALADPVVRAASAPLAPGSTLAGAGAGSSYFRPVQGGSLPGPRPHPGSAFNPVGSRLGANPRDPRVLALYRPGTGLAPGEAGEGGPASPASSSGRGRPARADAKPEVVKRARTEASPLAVAAAPGASAPSLAGAGGAQHGPLIAHARGGTQRSQAGRVGGWDGGVSGGCPWLAWHAWGQGEPLHATAHHAPCEDTPPQSHHASPLPRRSEEAGEGAWARGAVRPQHALAAAARGHPRACARWAPAAGRRRHRCCAACGEPRPAPHPEVGAEPPGPALAGCQAGRPGVHGAAGQRRAAAARQAAHQAAER